ncbi:MAG: 4-alpha-glucanotransferase [Nitrosomonadales bacterium]|nr:4-alpha-glucanotransferase [Nitrosomonadales bacterium]
MHFARSSGILLHPTSLPGAYGSGDFGAAAYHFVNWLVSAGQKMWQILPLGGIGPGNSPYMSSSAFAGNVLLIDLDELRELGWLADGELTPSLDFQVHRIDYGVVHQYRMDKLRLAASRFFSGRQGYEEYEAFCAAEWSWLDDYSLFMALAEHHDWKDWCDWGLELARREERALSAARAELSDDVEFWRFCQWCFFRQWRKLKQYANERGVQIVGDIPIFIAYQSAEVWARQELFDLAEDYRPAVVAGVPPDFFSETGQRWGNPLYHWAAHEAEGYAWWIERIRNTIALVDIVRIDHFRGFAGYWEIPASEPTAIQGRWMPGPGDKLFHAIQNALGKLPIIAEDLGVITPDVVALREQFGLPGMRILQFAFGGGSDNSFLPHNYQRNTVVYGGTHDNDTAQGWFASATSHERAYACKYLNTDGQEIHWDLIHAASQSIADLAIHSFQDVLGLGTEHRMNLPGKSEGYWEWRYSWDQVQPDHAERLYEITAVHGRCDMGRLSF